MYESEVAGAQAIAALQDRGFCILPSRFSRRIIESVREGFRPVLLDYLDKNTDRPNRGPHRYCLPLPFHPPCFAPELFFDAEVLRIVTAAMGARVVADQWYCDVPLRGSICQAMHADYQRPLFEENPDLALPPYMLAVSFPLVEIAGENGPIEIAPGTHRMPRAAALDAVGEGRIGIEAVPLTPGDVLIRHPWALHRGTPNTTGTPRALATIRYVRQWYTDDSRESGSIPRVVWESLSKEQQSMMRFPIGA